MKYRNLINEQSQDITVLSQLLKTYVDSYRLLIGGASELYNVNLAKKSEVKKALDRVSELGELIDKLIVSLDKCESGYIKYCKIKTHFFVCLFVCSPGYTGTCYVDQPGLAKICLSVPLWAGD